MGSNSSCCTTLPACAGQHRQAGGTVRTDRGDQSYLTDSLRCPKIMIFILDIRRLSNGLMRVCVLRHGETKRVLSWTPEKMVGSLPLNDVDAGRADHD